MGIGVLFLCSMTQITETINLGELIDLLVYQTENYVRITSGLSSQQEIDDCNKLLGFLLNEYEKRQQYLTSYN